MAEWVDGSTKIVGPHKDLRHRSAPSGPQTRAQWFRALIVVAVSGGISADVIVLAPTTKMSKRVRISTLGPRL